MVDARPARRGLWIFALALFLTSAELGWWLVLNLRAAGAQRSDRIALLERDAALATRLYNSFDNQSSREADAWLAQHFPKLRWQCNKGASHCQAEPSDKALMRLDARYFAARRMFFAEGGFLFLMLTLGASIMLRAMRREVMMVRQQANFLAAVTHELKSPLATIRLAVETLKRREPTKATLARYLETLLSEAHRLENLVNNVLMASRLSGPKARRAYVSSGLRLDVTRELEAVMSQVRDERNQIKLSLPSEPIYVAIEAQDFRTIVRNLVDNALKYAKASETIAVRLTAHNALVRLEVADNGPGLSAQAQRRVFDKFFRVGDELTRSHEGSGLGLFLVRALAEAAGGEAHVESDGPECGALFWVSLPQTSAVDEGRRGAA